MPSDVPGGPLDPKVLDEIELALRNYDPRLRPEACARLIAELAALQTPGHELRRIWIGIATVALIAAAKTPPGGSSDRTTPFSKFAA